MNSKDRYLKEVFGPWLKKKREKAGLTQRKVGEELSYTTAQFVSNWERGLILPPFPTLKELSKLYGFTLKDLEPVYVEYSLVKLREAFGV